MSGGSNPALLCNLARLDRMSHLNSKVKFNDTVGQKWAGVGVPNYGDWAVKIFYTEWVWVLKGCSLARYLYHLQNNSPIFNDYTWPNSLMKVDKEVLWLASRKVFRACHNF